MKTLLLLRHAKSDWSGEEVDFDRPINDRGRLAAARVSKELADESIDSILCSPSLRTRQTLDLLSLKAPVTMEPRIYEAGTDQLVHLISETDDSVERLLLVGHMPAIAATAISLARGDSGECFQRLREGYPTAALSKLQLNVDSWREVGPGRATIERFVCPRELA